jgi:nicotinamidase-related amidase
MEQGTDITYLQFKVVRAKSPVTLSFRALVNYRSLHGRTHANGWVMQVSSSVPHGLRVDAFAGATPFFLLSDAAQATVVNQWYSGLELEAEKERGLDDTEDVLCAGSFSTTLSQGIPPGKGCYSDLGAPNSVNRVRHLRLGVGEKITAPNGSESRILIRETWNTDIVPELKPQPGDDVIYKTRYSGFFETDLDARLKKFEVAHLIITGCTTSICVDSTVRDAMFRDYLCVLLADCMREPIGHGSSRSNHDASLLSAEMALGWVSDSERFLKAVQP